MKEQFRGQTAIGDADSVVCNGQHLYLICRAMPMQLQFVAEPILREAAKGIIDDSTTDKIVEKIVNQETAYTFHIFIGLKGSEIPIPQTDGQRLDVRKSNGIDGFMEEAKPACYVI